jgi:hypothetical protein
MTGSITNHSPGGNEFTENYGLPSTASSETGGGHELAGNNPRTGDNSFGRC